MSFLVISSFYGTVCAMEMMYIDHLLCQRKIRQSPTKQRAQISTLNGYSTLTYHCTCSLYILLSQTNGQTSVTVA
ncbi:hypothetical protein POJ06DRAFT_241773 [Lipomyces tetrasporus]|uniref:Secreted protein n=1 Tax=Lipomyces tetrasporus TaxID=54092 RepID=A0AAD7QXN5_9ASCO|nr:uncharacterized protein POJ06DRAFT_241773 [Lipomyces tetrasporus]KAJ8103400.1 hypothetical protein POJ06DRAFT_241773 [Lipomyces tetrasporus]